MNWFRRRREAREKFFREMIKEGVKNYPEIQKKRLDNKKIAIEGLLKHRETTNASCPYITPKIDSDGLYDLVKDPDEDLLDLPLGISKGSVRAIIALSFTTGFFLVTMIMFAKRSIPIVMIFEMWKMLAIILSVVIGSYFYSRLKIGGGFFK